MLVYSGIVGHDTIRETVGFLKEARVLVNVSEAKAKLSKLIDMVCHGEKVVIAKNNLPLVDLVPHHSDEKRTLGLLEGQFEVPDSFDDEDLEIEKMFYGDNQ